MAKTKKIITSDQLDFFQQLESDPLETLQAHDLDMHHELLGAVKAALKEARRHNLGREGVVDRMNECMPDLDKSITLRQLNAWTAKSKEHSEFPACYIPAFCWATGCELPLQVLANALLLDLTDQRMKLATQLGQNMLKQAELRRANHSIKQVLENT